MSEAEVFDHIVGLGYDCRVAYNLRRTFGFETAYPFDWWVTPLPALTAFLGDPSIERLYDPALLEPAMSGGAIRAIRNAHYDIQMEHEFPRGEDGAVRGDWLAHTGKARARTEFLLRRFLAIPAGSRVLFVRWTKRKEGRELGRAFEPLVHDLLERLELRFPHVQRSLLLIDPPVLIRAPGVEILRINDPVKAWQGTPELWTERLHDMGLVHADSHSDSKTVFSPEDDHHYLGRDSRARRAPVA